MIRNAWFQLLLLALAALPIAMLLFALSEGSLAGGATQLGSWIWASVHAFAQILAMIFLPGLFAALLVTNCHCFEAYPFPVCYLGVLIELVVIWAVLRYRRPILRLLRWVA